MMCDARRDNFECYIADLNSRCDAPPQYSAYIHSDEWNDRREAYLHYYCNRCRGCLSIERPLQLHHLTYERIGREEIEDCQILCKRCHQRRHFCEVCGSKLNYIENYPEVNCVLCVECANTI
jgi:5-methylcytosine-specific restriction endonuclease McrA